VKIGLSSKEIEALSYTDPVDWQREIAWQLAKLRESLDGALITSNQWKDKEHRVTLNK